MLRISARGFSTGKLEDIPVRLRIWNADPAWTEEDWSGGRHSEVCLRIQESQIDLDSDHLDQSDPTHPSDLGSEETGMLCLGMNVLKIIVPIVVVCCLLIAVWLWRRSRSRTSQRSEKLERMESALSPSAARLHLHPPPSYDQCSPLRFHEEEAKETAAAALKESRPISESAEEFPLLQATKCPSPCQSEQGKDEKSTVHIEGTTTASWSYRDAISRRWEELLQNMDVAKVEDHMISKNKLQLSEREELNVEMVRRRRRSALLHYVQSRDLKVFDAFCHGLVAAGQTHLAEMLRHPSLRLEYCDSEL
ncbi:unnamed protein product [Darwinula stevensoni]|uniref:CARD domain-containing protein n=1 Tax=Darwinula stevensoni TaxID=69355 RepID=A0A7R9A8Y1_9CRUS|nr:unnamed protein product [Darwinula stevensoni]CAG0896744.1 unnamed protein product [Darwinula stevensoni]